MKHIVPTLLGLLLTSACVQQDSNWVKEANGNTFTVVAQHSSFWRNVTVSNNGATWAGELQGGTEKWDERKRVLAGLAEEEIKRLCTNNSYTIKSDPTYIMVDRDYQALGAQFGVIGALTAGVIAEANSEDKNLPTAGIFNYKCDEQGK